MALAQLLRKARGPLVMTGVAASLALSLVVTTPANAAAAVGTKDFLSAAQIRGAVAAIPATAARAPLMGPIGVGVGAGLMLAWATADWWLPWVHEGLQEQFPDIFGGAKEDQVPPTQSGSVPPHPQIQITNWRSTGHSSFAWDVYYSGSEDWSWQYNTVAWGATCFDNGKVRPVEGTSNGILRAGGSERREVTFGCPLGGELRGITLCAVGAGVPYCPVSGEGYPGPVNAVTWGTHMQASEAVDPYSDDVAYTTTVECITDDGRIASVSSTSKGSDLAVNVPSCAAAGLGHSTGKTDITAQTPITTAPQPIYSVPAYGPDSQYPNCGPHLPGSGCKLSVWIDGKECIEGQWNCENWSRIYRDTPTRVDCHYGPYLATVADCALLERAYEVGGTTSTSANTDGNPDTRDDTDARGNTQPKPSEGTGTGTVPGTGGSVGTIPGGASAEEAACWPTGWGMLNPLEWVYRPVSCVLVAAFQPTTDLQTRISSMEASFAGKVPMTWFGVGEGISGGACPADWAVTLNGQRHSLICGTQADGIIQGFRPILGAMLAIAAVWPLIRSLFYAAIPIFKVNPS